MVHLVYTDNAVQRRMALYCLRDLGQTGHEAQAAYLASLNDAEAAALPLTPKRMLFW